MLGDEGTQEDADGVVAAMKASAVDRVDFAERWATAVKAMGMNPEAE